jgi:hypothetical protein
MRNPVDRELLGYPGNPSVLAGEKLVLHVSAKVPRFAVQFYRSGATLVPMGTLSRTLLAGHDSAPGAGYDDWNWPAYSFSIPIGWPSGVYIAHLSNADPSSGMCVEQASIGHYASDSQVLFVVRSPTQGQSTRILYKLPLATYHAYNFEGGYSMYQNNVGAVSIMRPGGGTGGLTWDWDIFPDVYDPYIKGTARGSPRHTFAHWDAFFISWLERKGYKVEYCTDLDLHADGGMLQRYRLLISVGQDEYWSADMRTAIDEFVSSGGNVAFFGGNTCWWRVHFLRDAGTGVIKGFSCNKQEGDLWWRLKPENALTGVSYRSGGGWWEGERKAEGASFGYHVQLADHWVFRGTGLCNGEVFGEQERLVGYECDGADLRVSEQGLTVPTGLDGTPSDFIPLSICPIDEHLWQSKVEREPFLGRSWTGPNGETKAATMGIHSNGGTVFTAATTDWARVLGGGEATTARITENVLRQFAFGT